MSKLRWTNTTIPKLYALSPSLRYSSPSHALLSSLFLSPPPSFLLASLSSWAPLMPVLLDRQKRSYKWPWVFILTCWTSPGTPIHTDTHSSVIQEVLLRSDEVSNGGMSRYPTPHLFSFELFREAVKIMQFVSSSQEVVTLPQWLSIFY